MKFSNRCSIVCKQSIEQMRERLIGGVVSSTLAFPCASIEFIKKLTAFRCNANGNPQ